MHDAYAGMVCYYHLTYYGKGKNFINFPFIIINLFNINIFDIV